MKLHRDNGAPIWQRLIDGPGHGNDRAWAVLAGPGDDACVAGLVPTREEEAGFYAARLRSSDGGTVWSRTVAGAILNPDDRSAWITLLPDGDMVLAGKTWGASYDVLLHRFEAADGSQVWHRQFNTSGSSADDARAMIRSTAGDRIYVAGVRGGDFMALAFDAADGELAWSSGYNGPPGWYDAATCVAEGPSGEVIVGGYSSGSTTGWDATLVAFDPIDGQQLWNQRYDPGFGETDEVTTIRLGPGGALYAGGYTYTSGTYSDMLVLNYQMETLSAPMPAPAAGLRLAAGPNPFAERLEIRFDLPGSVPAALEVLDLQGRRVARLDPGTLIRGSQRLEWDGRDASGRRLPDGIYFVRLSSQATARTVKVVRIGGGATAR